MGSNEDFWSTLPIPQAHTECQLSATETALLADWVRGTHVLRPYHPISTLARTKCPDTPPVSLSLPALGLLICVQSYLYGIATPPDAKPSETQWVGERTV